MKSLLNPLKALRYLYVAFKKRIASQKGILIFIGMDFQGEFDIIYPGYKFCYCFEPNPERFKKIQKKYGHRKNIFLFNYAIANYDGEIEFNISSNNEGASSSIGTFDRKWENMTKIKMLYKIKVPCINLYNFIKKEKIDYIDDYISDIQGMDLEVLKSLSVLIENKKIGTIKCEVTKDIYKNIYINLPDNSESGFKKLLSKNYELVAKGQGILFDYKYDKVPEDAWEMDCKWKLKKGN